MSLFPGEGLASQTQQEWTSTNLILDPPPTMLTLSDDGRRLVYGAPAEGLFLREMHSEVSVSIPATSGFREAVFFSPGDERIVYSDSTRQLHHRSLTDDFADEDLGAGIMGFVGPICQHE